MKASLFCTARYIGAAPHDIWPLSNSEAGFICATAGLPSHMASMRPCSLHVRNDPDPQCPRCAPSPAQIVGMSLSGYLLNEIREMAERPTLDELRARLERRSGTRLPDQAVRAERDVR